MPEASVAILPGDQHKKSRKLLPIKWLPIIDGNEFTLTMFIGVLRKLGSILIRWLLLLPERFGGDVSVSPRQI